MRGFTRRFMSLFLALSILFGMLQMPIMALDFVEGGGGVIWIPTTPDQGTEENGMLTFDDYDFDAVLDSEGKLTISNTDKIDEFQFENLDPNLKEQVVSLVLSDGILQIGSSAFYEFSNLASVVLPDGLTTIGWNAFSQCVSLREISIPASVTLIQGNAFEGCESLVSVDISENSELAEIYSSAFQGCTSLESFVIPDALTEISDSTFLNCESLVSVTVSPNSQLKTINSDAFGSCTQLTEITFPEGLERIGYRAFQGCISLTSITIPASVTGIAVSAFNRCTGLNSISVAKENKDYHSAGNTLINWYGELLQGCNNSVIPDDGSVISIADGAFEEMAGLVSVAIPQGVTEIGDNVFTNCVNLTSVTIADGVTYIGESMFDGCESLETITIPNSVTYIGERMFNWCTSLKSVTLSEGLTTIPGSCFYGCTSLESVVIPDGIGFIGTYAFVYCEKLRSVVLPKQLEQIGYDAFRDCTALESITIPANVTRINENVFEFCENLGSISVEEGNEVYHSAANTIIETATKTLILGCKNSVIPTDGSVTSIGNGAFKGCKDLVSVTIPSGVTEIGAWAFYGCTGVTSITIPNSVTSIGFEAFGSCESLSSITVEEGNEVYHSAGNTLIETASKTLLLGCKNSVIPDDESVTSIAERAFCSVGMSIRIPLHITSIADSAFNTSDPELVLFVHLGSCGEDYARAHGVSFEYVTHEDGSKISFSAKVFGDDGQVSEADYDVLWYDGTVLLGKGNTIVLTKRPDDLRFRVVLGEDLAFVYQAHAGDAVPSEVTDVSLTLSRLETVTVSGRVTDLLGNEINGASMTVIQYAESFSKDYSISVDENGYFAFDALCLSTKLRIRADTYYNRLVSISGEELSKNISLGDVQMTPLPTCRIMLSGVVIGTSLDDEQFLQSELLNFDGLSFRLFNQTTQNEIVDFTAQYPYLIPAADTVSPYDTLEIQMVDTYGVKTAETVVVQLDENCLAEANLVLLENGRLSIYRNLGNAKNCVMVFDSKGNRVLYENIGETYASMPLAAGEYDVVLMGRSSLLDNMDHLSKLNACGMAKDVDYVLRRVSVQNGKVTEITDLTVPVFEEERFWYIEKENTLFTANHTSCVVGTTLLLRCEYKLKPSYKASGETVILELPEGFTVLSQGVYWNKTAVNYTLDEQVLTIYTNESEGILYVYVVPLTASSECVVNASLAFSMGGDNITQSVGTISLKIANATILIPEKTGTDSVIINGKAPAKSKVTVFSNGVVVATVTANASGNYRATIRLNEPKNNSYYAIYANIQSEYNDIEYETAMSWLHYREDFCYVETIEVINGDKTITLNIRENEYPSQYTWTGNCSYSFRVAFSNGSAKRLSDVYVVTAGTNGKETYIPMTNKPGTDIWVGSITYKDSTDLPCGYNVVFTESENDTAYINEQNFYDGVLQTGEELEKFGVGFSEDIGVVSEETDSSITYVLVDKQNDNAPIMRMAQNTLTYTQKSEDVLLKDGYTKMIDGENTVVYVKKSNTPFSETYEIVIPSAKQHVSCSVVIDETWYANNVPSVASYDLSPQGGMQYAQGMLSIAAVLMDFASLGLAGNFVLCLDVARLNNLIKNNDIIFTSWAELLPLALERKCPDGSYALSTAQYQAFYAEYTALVLDYYAAREGLYLEVEAYQMYSALLNGALGLLPHASSVVSSYVCLHSVAAAGSFGMLGAGMLRSQTLDYTIKKTHESYMEKLDNLRDRIYAAAKCPEDPEDDPDDGKPENKPRNQAVPGDGVDVPLLIDPSGYVCEAVPSNRLEGVKVEAYYYDSEKGDVFWNAEEWDQVNPLYTDKEGRYAWDVPMGQWLVKFSKDGYYDADSRNDPDADENGYLPVPPPQTEVNIALVSKMAPTVKQVNAYTESVRIAFSQYMRIDSINTHTVTVTADGKTVEGKIVPINAETSFDDPNVEYASVFTFIPETKLGDSVKVSIQGVINYAGTAMANGYEEELKVYLLPKDLVVPQSATVVYGDSAHFIVELLPKEAGANKTVCVTSLTPDIISVSTASVITDKNGRALITLQGELPGTGKIRLTVEGTDLTADVTVISQTAARANTCQKVTSNLESGSKVPAGTQITLSTETEGATIYYTLDLSCPCDDNNPARIRYDGPITITEDVTIIAYAIKEGMTPSATVGFTYTIAELTCQDDPNIPHTYAEGVVIKPATTDEEGIMSYRCTVCGHTKTESIPKLSAEDGLPTYVIVLIIVGSILCLAVIAFLVCYYVIKKARSRKE